MGFTLKGKNLLLKEKVISLKVDLYQKGRQNSRVASPENIPMHLYTVYESYFFFFFLAMADLLHFRVQILCSSFHKNNATTSGHLTLLHSERPKLHTILAFLSAIGLIRLI